MILGVWGGSAQRFVHTRRCRFGAPQIRPGSGAVGVPGVRVVRTKVSDRATWALRWEVGVMTENWAEPARMMVERLLLDAGASGLSGLWSLAKAAQQATLRLALDPAADPDLSMTHAGMDLGELLEACQAAGPDPTAAAGDVRRVPGRRRRRQPSGRSPASTDLADRGPTAQLGEPAGENGVVDGGHVRTGDFECSGPRPGTRACRGSLPAGPAPRRAPRSWLPPS